MEGKGNLVRKLQMRGWQRDGLGQSDCKGDRGSAGAVQRARRDGGQRR